jgi:hypothetical protein
METKRNKQLLERLNNSRKSLRNWIERERTRESLKKILRPKKELWTTLILFTSHFKRKMTTNRYKSNRN